MPKLISNIGKTFSSFRSLSLIEKMALICIGIFTSIYIYQSFFESYNFPKAQDDVKIFLIHFNKIIESNSFSELVNNILFQNKIHPKLDSRFISIVSWLLFGKISFKFILITGHLLFLSSIFLLRKIFSSLPLHIFLFSAFLLFIPSSYVWQWSVGVWGYFSYLFLISLIAYFIFKERIVSASITSFFTVFTLGSGLLSFGFILFFSYYLITQRNTQSFSKKDLVIYVSTILIGILSFYFLVLKHATEGGNSTMSELSIISMVQYCTYFMLGGVFSDLGVELSPSIVMILCLVSLSILSYLIVKNFKQLSKPSVIGISLLAIIMANAIISSFLRTEIESAFAKPPSRYEIFSFYFLAIILLVGFDILQSRKAVNFRSNIWSIIFVPVILLYTVKLNQNLDRSKVFKDKIVYKFMDAATQSGQRKGYRINYFIENELYAPPVKDINSTVPHTKTKHFNRRIGKKTDVHFLRNHRDSSSLYVSGLYLLRESKDDNLEFKIRTANGTTILSRSYALTFTAGYKTERKEISAKVHPVKLKLNDKLGFNFTLYESDLLEQLDGTLFLSVSKDEKLVYNHPIDFGTITDPPSEISEQ